MKGSSKLENQGKNDEGADPSSPARTEEKVNSEKGMIASMKFDPLTPLRLPLTKYEKSRIIGARALQLSLGAPILIEIPAGLTDPIAIADFELKANVLPITIRRKLPRGKFENIPLSKLATDWI
ncbi:MAG: DNA-directed RNA polymerase subunit K [Candidatus Atabeyarchaeum deiterrae]